MGVYAEFGGVDYRLVQPFKAAMVRWGSRTLEFPERYGIRIDRDLLHAHGASWEYVGQRRHTTCTVIEGLGHLNLIAEWLYQIGGVQRTYYDVIARAAALIVVIDVISQGAQPFLWVDYIAASDSDWFADERRADDYGRGCYDICHELGMALPAGESAPMRYLVRPEVVPHAAELVGAVSGIIVPKERKVDGRKLTAGDRILGAQSSGLHSNGSSLVIAKAMELPDKFLTRLPNGRTLGEECLNPIVSYAPLVLGLLDAGVDVHALLPGTGDGVGKLAYDPRAYTYRVTDWVEVPMLFQWLREQFHLSPLDMLKTFNMGIGYYVFVPPHEVDHALSVSVQVGCPLFQLGVVEEGERMTIFEPEGGVKVPPPGE